MFMQLFEKTYRDFITKQNKKLLPPNSLDPEVFHFPEDGTDPILLPAIRQQILHNIQEINQADSAFTNTRVWNYVLTGPILDKDSSDRCPIIIKVQINKANLDDVLKERILQTIKDINDKLAIGTQHPIVYIPTVREIDPNELNGGYNVFRQAWIKKPNFLEEKKNNSSDLSRIKQKSKHSLINRLRKIERV